MSMINKVSVFGFADHTPKDQVYKDAVEACRLLAESGYVILNGGGPGIMKAATEGAKKGGGKSVGITYYPDEEDCHHHQNFEGRDHSNKFDSEVVEETYGLRTLKLLEWGDAYLIFHGGTGTISEFGMAWGLAKIHFGHHRPLVLYGDFWHEIMETLSTNMEVGEIALKVYEIVNTPEAALAAVKRWDNATIEQFNSCEFHAH